MSGAPFTAGEATLDRLHLLVAELRKWNPAINLVAAATLADAWTRHIAESAHLADLVAPPAHWADLGSGGGFPGLVVAILLAERSPGSRVTLVESDGRKAAFLRQTAFLAGVSVAVIDRRIEEVPPLRAGVVSARALAPLGRLLPLVHRHLAPEGTGLLPKGARVAEELASVAGTWSFDLRRHPAAGAGGGDVLEIRNLRHG
jgi:16S rRNA (guanine527-N7)-methyltransferase